MSARLAPSLAQSGDNVELVPYGRLGGPSGGDASYEADGVPWARTFEALKRHAILILLMVAAGAGVGLLAARRIVPVYEVQSKIWIGAGGSSQTGPIRPQQLLPATSWDELLRSYAIVDPVVKKLRLNLSYKQPADSALFTNFESLPSLRPGAYVLKIQAGGRYVLSGGNDSVIEKGQLGDSVGRHAGFAWLPNARLLQPGRVLSFSVSTVRSASVGLLSTLKASIPDDGQFLTVKLSGPNPRRAATTLNAWVEQFVASADQLKKRHLLEFKGILSEQLSVAGNQLQDAEVQLE